MLFADLNAELATFDDNLYVLPTYQRNRFEGFLRCLQEDEKTVANRSAQSRSRQFRIRAVLADIFQGISPDLFVLTTLSTSATKLCGVTQRGLIPELRNWWQKVTHPKGLSLLATQLLEEHLIHNLIKPTVKRKVDEAGMERPVSQRRDSSQIRLTPLVSALLIRQQHRSLGRFINLPLATSGWGYLRAWWVMYY